MERDTAALTRSQWGALGASVGAALAAYVLAGSLESALVRAFQPTELELTWISDVVLAVAFGVAVYLWRHLRASREILAARERADLVLQTQLAVAADVQRRLLPALPRPGHGLTWAARLHSAGRIGGDFYDIVEQGPARWLLLVADVSGKGIPAAMALGSLRASFRAVAAEHERPADALFRLSALLHEAWEGTPYVTCIMAQVDATARRLVWASAGHPPGLLTGRQGTQLLGPSGPPAGLWPGQRYDERALPLTGGDLCVFLTDGVTEALEDDRRSAVDRVVETVRGVPPAAQAACDAVMALGLRGRGPAGIGDWDDDRTVVVVAFEGTGDPG